MTYLAIRDGKVVLTLPNPTIKTDGTIWMHGIPLTDGQSEDAKHLGVVALKALVVGKKWSEIPQGCFAKVGTSASGLLVIRQDEWLAQKVAALTPAQKERRRITLLYAEADRRYHASDEDNVSDACRLRSEADRALGAWKVQYPEEARSEEAQRLREEAQRLRDKAAGAMTFDADGWLSSEDQKKRRDEFIARAVALEEQANQFQGGSR